MPCSPPAGFFVFYEVHEYQLLKCNGAFAIASDHRITIPPFARVLFSDACGLSQIQILINKKNPAFSGRDFSKKKKNDLMLPTANDGKS